MTREDWKELYNIAYERESFESFMEAARALLADGGKGEAVAWRHSKTLCLYETEEEVPLADGDEWAEPLYTAPQAECAPREAQPVCWITREQLAKVGDESEDAWVYWAETGHVAEPDEIALYAAPTPERADADTAGADRPIMRFNIFVNLINPDPNGMYVRYEDHARAILAANGKKK